MPLFQFIAKNVGVRRAEGRYILATNLDILCSSPLMAFLASGDLCPDCLYRVDRYDVEGDVHLGAEMEDQLNYCAHHIVRVHTQTGSSRYVARTAMAQRIRRVASKLGSGWSAVIGKKSTDELHTVACGDFTMMARERWHALKGYPEIPSHAYVDGLICYMAVSSGLREVILREPLRVYHQEHGQMFLGGESERPVMDYRQYRAWCTQMIDSGRPLILNDDRWGFGDEALKDERIVG